MKSVDDKTLAQRTSAVEPEIRTDSAHNIFAYEARRVLADPVIDVNGYRIKPYRMAYPDSSAIHAITTFDFAGFLNELLPARTDPDLHGFGFSILHLGRDGMYLLIGRWYGGNMLMSDTYQISINANSGKPTFTRLQVFACIWEMCVYAHERNAWVATVMASSRGLSGVDRYLECKLEGWV